MYFTSMTVTLGHDVYIKYGLYLLRDLMKVTLQVREDENELMTASW